MIESKVIGILENVWKIDKVESFVSKRFLTSSHSELASAIPDEEIEIEEVFGKDEIGAIWSNYKPYLLEHNVIPFMCALGGNNVFCIGASDENLGNVYYYDFDFGIFMVNDNIMSFLSSLKEK
jgi:hypothetical protein